jgi:hypothetical protein
MKRCGCSRPIRSISVAEEFQPLAYSVRPYAGECFDTWVDRVAERHETNRLDLFRHLKLRDVLAGQDLARGVVRYGRRDAVASDQLCAVLARSTGSRLSALKTLILAVPNNVLLPPACRTYACPQCWLSWHRAGEPLRIQRQWIFCMVWRCDSHSLPLANMSGLLDQPWRMREPLLLRTIAQSRDIQRILPLRRGAITEMRAAMGHIMGHRSTTMSTPATGARLSKNCYHFAGNRIGLLAAAHSDNSALAGRYDALFGPPHRPRLVRSQTARDCVANISDTYATLAARHLSRRSALLCQLAQRLDQAADQMRKAQQAHVLRARWCVSIQQMRDRIAAERALHPQTEAVVVKALRQALDHLDSVAQETRWLTSEDDETVPSIDDLQRSVRRRLEDLAPAYLLPLIGCRALRSGTR